jgi:hypothetical protein
VINSASSRNRQPGALCNGFALATLVDLFSQAVTEVASQRTARASLNPLEGVISYYERGPGYSLSVLDSCQAATLEVMQNITTPERRAWICRNTVER